MKGGVSAVQLFLENPFAIVIITILCLAIVFYFWTQTRLKWILYLMGGVILAGAGLVAIERMIVTDRESIRESMIVLASHVANDNPDEVIKYFSQDDETESVRNRAIRFMESTDIQACRVSRFKEFVWDENAGSKTCELHLIAVGDASRQGYSFHGAQEVILQLKQEADGQWRIRDYSYRSPIPRPRQ